jgi:hypothetical protein
VLVVAAPGAVEAPAVLELRLVEVTVVLEPRVVEVLVVSAPGRVEACVEVWVVVDAAALVVTVFVVVGAVASESVASLMSAAASTPSESATTTATPATRPLQRGELASRVRAAAPQLKHHSWSGRSAAPHSGQASPGTAPAGGDGAFGALTSPTPAGE